MRLKINDRIKEKIKFYQYSFIKKNIREGKNYVQQIRSQ